MNSKYVLALLLLTLLTLVSGASDAAMITFTRQDLGSNQFIDSFIIRASATDPSIEQVSLFFDSTSFQDIIDSSLTPPTGWDALAIGPDPILGVTDVIADFLALSSDVGIAPGQSLGDFSVAYLWAGQGVPPTEIPFEIFDPAGNFSVPLLSGTATFVPLPASIYLFMSPLALGFMVTTIKNVRRKK